MPKYPIFFVSLLLLSINLISAQAQVLELELNKKSFTPNDKLVIFGSASARDSLIIELFNPTGNLVFRTQIDVKPNGKFAEILFIWPEPDEQRFRIGTYTLIARSSIYKDISVSEVIRFQIKEEKMVEEQEIIEQRLMLDASIPSIASINDSIPIIVYASLNNSPLIGLEEINGLIIMPDDDEQELTFEPLLDGIYKSEFNASKEGYHTIIINAEHQGLIANKVFIIKVEDMVTDKLSSKIDDIDRSLRDSIDQLDAKLLNNTLSIREDVDSMKDSIDNVSSAIGQLSALLLPIVGMIAIIVALQATILSRRR